MYALWFGLCVRFNLVKALPSAPTQFARVSPKPCRFLGPGSLRAHTVTLQLLDRTGTLLFPPSLVGLGCGQVSQQSSLEVCACKLWLYGGAFSPRRVPDLRN